MVLPIIDILKEPYLVRSDTDPLQYKITTHLDLVYAAFHDPNVSLEIDQVIKSDLEKNTSYKFAQQQMTTPLPYALNDYVTSPKIILAPLVDDAINAVGEKLTNGQVIYHGSADSPRTIFTPPLTTRPLSTTLSPQIAIQEIVHNSKAYNAGRYVIYILTVKDPNTNVFLYPEMGDPVVVPIGADPDSSDMFEMDELEILFATGACVIIDTEKKIDDAIAYHHSGLSKKVPVYICEGTIS